MQLVNVLGQVVVEPVLFGASSTTTTSFPSALKGRPIRSVTLACGDYVAYWDGKIGGGREAASGVYGQLLTVDGEAQAPRRIYYKK
jgi:hypothetical protein